MALFVWALVALLAAAGYAAVVPVMYHAILALFLDEYDSPLATNREAWIGAVGWPGVLLVLTAITVWEAFGAGLAGLREARQEARKRQRPWRKRGNVVHVDVRAVRRRR